MKCSLYYLVGFMAAVSGRVAAQGTYTTPYSFSTVAGFVTAGAVDGPANLARFNDPYGVAVDAAGNIYVADALNQTIRKITTAGVVTTLAGHLPSSSIVESVDGMGSAARFGSPQSVAVDVAGTLYVADMLNHTIRKVTPDGFVTTFAGMAHISGSADGVGGDARFNRPNSVAVDKAGNVYVSEEGNHTVRKITSTGAVSTIAGSAGSSGSADGFGSAARFNGPKGIAVDSAGTVYVSDTGNFTVRKIATDGSVSTLAGQVGLPGSVDGSGSAAKLGYPQGLAVDSMGNIFVAEQGWYTIRKITPAGVVTTLAGQPAVNGSLDGVGAAAQFFSPRAVAVDGMGDVIVADTQNNRIRRVTPAGAVTTVAGPAGAASGTDGAGSAARFFSPWVIAVDRSGNTYVGDTNNHTIRKISSGGIVTTLAGEAGHSSFDSVDGVGSAARFGNIYGLAVDANGNVYASNSSKGLVKKITPGGVVSTLAGGNYTGPYGTDGAGATVNLLSLSGLAVDVAGNIYAAELHAIRKITPAGFVSTLAGQVLSSGSVDGAGAVARFTSPQGLAVDGSGNVYVADTNNNTVRKITPAGVVSTIAGKSGLGGSGNADGVGSAALFYQPGGVAVDTAGNVYVADSGNSVIRRITPAGVVSTLAGKSTTFDLLTRQAAFGATDGTGSAVGFNRPRGLAVDATGNLYVVDTYNETIRHGVVASSAFTPGFSSQPLNQTVALAGNVAFTVAPTGNPTVGLRWQVSTDGGATFTDISDSSPYSGATATTLTITGATAGMNNNRYRCVASNAVLPNATSTSATLTVKLPPVVATQPASQATAVGGNANLSVAASGTQTLSYQWQLNGSNVSGGTAASLTVANVQPANTGIYTARVTDAVGSTTSEAAMVGVATSEKVIGTGAEIARDIYVEANKNTFDQVALQGAAATITADAGQITRMSFVDLTDDIVQVEFSGAGTLSLVLENPSGPAAAVNYNQAATSYMKGHASIVIVGADETTNVGVFSVGRLTAVNQSLFKNEIAYDGMANIAYLAIQSPSGKFGGLRTANTSYFATKGFTGIYAPGVQFSGPVFVGDISASDAASPVLMIASSPDARITGGDLLQANGQPVKVSSLTSWKFTAGSTSHVANSLPAQTNKCVLQQNGVDVTAQVVVNP